jgi:hypothetical protein
LYAVAYEEFRQGKWIPNIEHAHAPSPYEAKAMVFGKGKIRRFIRIVGVAPAIGGHAKDENADRVVL